MRGLSPYRRPRCLPRLGDLGSRQTPSGWPGCTGGQPRCIRRRNVDRGMGNDPQALREIDRAAQRWAAGTHYYAGLADKIEGRRSPRQTRTTSFIRAVSRSAWSPRHAVEFALLLMTWKLAPALAARLHGGGQSRPSTRPSRRSVSPTHRESRLPARRRQRGDRIVAGNRRGARLAPGRGQGGVHRLDRHRSGSRRAAAQNINKSPWNLAASRRRFVFPDADLAGSRQRSHRGRFAATGQTCMPAPA